MKKGDIQDIQSELKGKTELLPEYEEELFKRIAVIEKQNGAVEPFPALDYYAVFFLFLLSLGLILAAVSMS